MYTDEILSMQGDSVLTIVYLVFVSSLVYDNVTGVKWVNVTITLVLRFYYMFLCLIAA